MLRVQVFADLWQADGVVALESLSLFVEGTAT